MFGDTMLFSSFSIFSFGICFVLLIAAYWLIETDKLTLGISFIVLACICATASYMISDDILIKGANKTVIDTEKMKMELSLMKNESNQEYYVKLVPNGYYIKEKDLFGGDNGEYVECENSNSTIIKENIDRPYVELTINHVGITAKNNIYGFFLPNSFKKYIYEEKYEIHVPQDKISE